jgi:hypothetical protein
VGVRDQALDGASRAVPSTFKITITLRQSTRDKHQSGGVQRSSLLDCLAVLSF